MRGVLAPAERGLKKYIFENNCLKTEPSERVMCDIPVFLEPFCTDKFSSVLFISTQPLSSHPFQIRICEIRRATSTWGCISSSPPPLFIYSHPHLSPSVHIPASSLLHLPTIHSRRELRRLFQIEALFWSLKCWI